jgi:hypothetical protein
MLRFTHAGESVEVDIEKLGLHEGLALQRATGHKMPAFLEAVKATDMQALCALGFVLLKFRMGKTDVTLEDVEEGRVPVSIADFDNAEPVPPTQNGRAKAKTPS